VLCAAKSHRSVFVQLDCIQLSKKEYDLHQSIQGHRWLGNNIHNIEHKQNIEQEQGKRKKTSKTSSTNKEGKKTKNN
jgi:hypothetical protein